jgi:hypothetical protein
LRDRRLEDAATMLVVVEHIEARGAGASMHRARLPESEPEADLRPRDSPHDESERPPLLPRQSSGCGADRITCSALALIKGAGV